MKKKQVLVAIFIVLFAGPHLQAQAVFSDAFKKTVAKILKNKVQNGVIHWLTDAEPVIGIVGRDLIGQVINSADPDELIRSVTNVVTTSVFIYNVQDILKTSVPDSIYQHVLQEARNFGWNEKKLIAYTSLYFYYSERLKYNLYISPYIFTMDDIKREMESLKTPKGNRWVAEVSKILVRKLRRGNEFPLDVQLLEVLQTLLLHQVRPAANAPLDGAMVVNLINKYKPKQGDKLSQLRASVQSENWAASAQGIFELFSGSINKKINKTAKDDGYAALPFDLHVMHELLANFAYLANSSFGGVNLQKFETNTLRTTTQLINSWISNYNVNKVRLDYGFMLASSYVDQSDEVRFIVLDQFRLGYFKKNWSIFLFASGALDPLLQEAFDKQNKVFLAGFGSRYARLNLSLGAALPYTDLERKNIKFAVSLGYELPLLEIVGNF